MLDLLMHLVWAVVLGALIELLDVWFPIWLSIGVSLVIVVLVCWFFYRFLGWKIWRLRR